LVLIQLPPTNVTGALPLSYNGFPFNLKRIKINAEIQINSAKPVVEIAPTSFILEG
jgi:hypothetical protein